MLKSGIVVDNKIIKLDDSDIIGYLKNALTTEDIQIFKANQKQQLFISDDVSFNNNTYIEFFVKFKNYVIIYNNCVYYADNFDSNSKISYASNGYTLKKLPKMVYENGKAKEIIDKDLEKLEQIGFEHSLSKENDLEYWFPKIENMGFKTPKTIITPFFDKEVELIKSYKWNELNKRAIIERIKYHSEGFDLKKDMFIRLGIFSDKFNFEACHIKNIDELPNKLMTIFDDLMFRLEWEKHINLVLREFITTNYNRETIYNGLPLNTEFRVFYDFTDKEILGIYNYWDVDDMLDHLKDKDDLMKFAKEAKIIEDEFKKLSPLLEEQVNTKMAKVNLRGKWSIDFMYDGSRFVLIDMAHAECSHYYDKVVKKIKFKHLV